MYARPHPFQHGAMRRETSQKMKNRSGALLLCAALLGQAAAAPLTNLDALRVATQAPNVLQKEQEYRQARLDLGDARAPDWRAVSDATASRTGGNSPGSASDLSAGVSLRFLGPQALGREENKRRQALNEAELAWQTAKLSASDALLDAWYDLVEAEQALAETRGALEVADLELRRVQAQAQSGVATELDVSRAGLARAQAQGAYTAADLSRQQAQGALLSLGVLIPQPSAVEATWTPLPLPQSVRDSYAVQQATLATAAARVRLGELQAQRGVQVQAQGSLSSGHFNLTLGLDRELTGTAAARTTLRDAGAASWNLGVNVALPLGNRLGHQVAQAERALLLAQQAEVQARARQAQVRQLWQGRMDDAGRNLTLAGQLFAEAQRNEAVVSQRLEQGLVPPAALAQARLATLKAQGQVWQARRSVDRAALQGWRVLGGWPDLVAASPLTVPQGDQP